MSATDTLELLPHQMEAFVTDRQFIAMVTGLGGGKTWTGARWLIGRAINFPDSLHLATANSVPQAKDLVIPALIQACEELDIPYRHKVIDGRSEEHTSELQSRSSC